LKSIPANKIKAMMRQDGWGCAGLFQAENARFALGNRRSIHLSYGSAEGPTAAKTTRMPIGAASGLEAATQANVKFRFDLAEQLPTFGA
jgi:hypothetical protein